MSTTYNNLARIHPQTGETFFSESIEGTGRYLVIDDAGFALATAYSTSPVGIVGVYEAAAAAESVYFDSIRFINNPLAFPWGGRMQGIIQVIGGSPGSFDQYHQLAACNTESGGTCNVFFPNSVGLQSSWMVAVWDYTDNAQQNPIQINPAGVGVENPEAPGTFTTSPFFLQQNSVSCVWVWDPENTVWKVFSYAGFIPIAAGGAPTNRVTWSLLEGQPASSAVGSSTPQVVGTTYFDLQTLRPASGNLTREVFFKCILSTTNSSNTANIDLIDVNNVLGSGVGAEVTGSNLTTSNTSATYISQRLTSLEDLETGGIFQVRIWISPQAASQQVTCYMAKLDVEYH